MKQPASVILPHLGDAAVEVLWPKAAAAYPPVDMESVSLWNPEWKVNAAEFEGTPRKLTDYAGRKNVLMTHPKDRTAPSVLERTFTVPKQGATLRFAVAAHEQGDWEVRVVANGELLKKQVVDRAGDRWKQISVDLGKFAGKPVQLRLENAATGWNFEFGYWSDLELKVSEQTASTR